MWIAWVSNQHRLRLTLAILYNKAMSDIRKRTGKTGTTYQVRYRLNDAYAYQSFNTRKEAKAFLESGQIQTQSSSKLTTKTVEEAIDEWLHVCKHEGRDGRDPITFYTEKTYSRRAEIMKAYGWQKILSDLKTPDVVAFRSWLLQKYSRYQAHKVLSSFHGVIKEMSLRGEIAANVAAGVSIRAESRYADKVLIPTPEDVHALLQAADRLANSRNQRIAKSWQRYRPMLYLAVDSGMRPQEYVALARANLKETGVQVERALERGGRKITVTKTPAGRRFIDLSEETLAMICHYLAHHAPPSDLDLIFATATGKWVETDHWRKRGFYAACLEAGLVMEERDKGNITLKPKYKPYDLRHFYASMLIDSNTNLKEIQRVMGHEDIKTTLNTYGHLIAAKDAATQSRGGLLGDIRAKSCGEFVADDS